jgi:hypothetical protein
MCKDSRADSSHGKHQGSRHPLSSTPSAQLRCS